MQHNIHDDVVEHQGRNHLTCAELHFQERRQQHRERRRNRADQKAHHKMQPRCHRHINAHKRGKEAAQHHAAFRRKVELVGGKHHAHGKARENGRDHARKHNPEGICVKRAVLCKQRPEKHLLKGAADIVRTKGDKDHRHRKRKEDRRKTARNLKEEHSFISHRAPSQSPRRSGV